MSDPLAGPTDEERAEFLDSGEWEEADFEFGLHIGGAVTVDFDQLEVNDLLKAAALSGERSTNFIKRAAMARIAEVLAAHRDESAPTAAAGSS